MTTVLVSGCYDVLHVGHIEFFIQARALGDRLVVCVAGDDVIRQHKGREPAMPAGHRAGVVAHCRHVDEVRVTALGELGLDFEPVFQEIRPDILAVTEDDQYEPQKRQLCARTGTRYVILPKSLTWTHPISTTEIRQRCRAPLWVPLRVDFAGGWLDVPRLARPDGRIVNCAIRPGLSIGNRWLQPGAGLGGSAAWSLLQGCNPVEAELGAGVGWQDPAIIQESGLCVWRSGPRPNLELRTSGIWLRGRMALWRAQGTHRTVDLVSASRDYDAIVAAGAVAREAVRREDLYLLTLAVQRSWAVQQQEGMAQLPGWGELASKYTGAGHGGYAVYLFGSPQRRDSFVAQCEQALAIEPYDRWENI